EQRLLARCFVAAAGLQCGFCIPGIALRAHALVQKSPHPSRDDIRRALDPHLCRCTGYLKIMDAIELFARVLRGEALPPLLESGGVGARMARYAGEETALGRQPFIDDLERPGMLHGALVLSPHPRARVLSIDTTRAAAIASVVTAADVPGERHYGILDSDWPGFVAIGEETRYTGDVIAAVAAEDEATARRAAALVEVEYEVLAPVLSMWSAATASCRCPSKAHVSGCQEERRLAVAALHTFGRTKIQRGDVDAALEASAHVVRGTWTTQRVEHLFLEPESALAEPLDDNRLRVYSSGQGIFDDQRQIAAFLGLALDDVLVEQVSAGGAFGGKEDLSIQAQTALLAWKTRRPVKLTLNREESVRIHPKRHPMSMDYVVGCDENGLLTAVRARIVGDSGAYASVGAKVLERAAGHACGAYHVPHADIESVAVRTNNPPCGAMRGFGANQTNFAMEGCIDALAKRCGRDPWEMRWRNALDVGSTITTGQILEKSVGLKQTLLAVLPAYKEAKGRGRAVGIACGVKNSGLGNGAKETGRARLVVEDDGTISIYNSFSEIGQGLLTVLVQFAVEVTGLPAGVFRPKVDTTYALGSGQTTGSRATMLAGRAVVDAARKLARDLDVILSRRSAAKDPLPLAHDTLKSGGSFAVSAAQDDTRPLAGRVYEGLAVVDDTNAVGADVERIKTHTAFGFATQLCILDDSGRIERIVAAHDVGRAINPAFCEGQIEGAVHMGLGYALSEELKCVEGMPSTHGLMNLGVLRATDTPPVEVILIEDPEPEGPFGAKGLGEIGLVPTAAAVAGALEAFDGIRRTSLPMKDSPAARVLRVGHTQSGDLNAHTHLYSGLASLGMPRPETSSFPEILEKIWWRLDRALDEESLRAAARLYVAEALQLGTTMLIDHHESPNFIEGSLDVLADVCQELGMRALLCYGATERNFGRDEAVRGLRECERFIRSNHRPLVRGAVGLHASFTVSDETIREAGDLCRSLGVRLHVHVAEDLCDVRDAERRGYPSPLQRLYTLGALVPGSILAHGVHLTDDDLRIVDELALWVVENPRSNEANGVGHPSRLPARVALGTDGFPSNMKAEGGGARHAAGSRDLAAQLFPDLAAPRVFDIHAIRAAAAAEAPRLWERMRGIE
ncbi:MAG: molybdopterin cofactor-binding domain-containing protein, partial [Thermoanaerobaculia bacterium]